MKHKWIITVLILLAVIGLFIAYAVYCWNGLFGSTEIKKGFSPQLLEKLQTRYGITIPEEAKFIEGYNTGGPDSSVLIIFECPVDNVSKLDNNKAITDYVKQLLKLDPAMYPAEQASKDSDVYTGDGLCDEWGPMDYELRNKGISYTSLSYRIEEDKLLIRFDGWRPGANFR